MGGAVGGLTSVRWEDEEVCRLVLFRQGLTRWEREGRLRGQLSVPLSPEGVAAVTAEARELSPLAPKVIYHGPDEAGRQTARLVAEHTTATVRELAGLAEMSLGLWQGLLVEEVKQRHPRVYRQWREAPERVAPPEGETVARVSERAGRALRKIRGRHRGETVVVVVPPMFGAVLRSVLAAERLADLTQVAGPGAQWEIFDL